MRPSSRSTPSPEANRPVSVKTPASSGDEIKPIACRDSRLRCTDSRLGGSTVLWRGGGGGDC